MKRLRGTRADVFGYAHVRKVEREPARPLPRPGERGWPASLTLDGYDRAVEIAGLPDMVRGYEHVKLGNVEQYVAALRALGASTPEVSA
nr:DUF6537 domain-containing protein [Nocardioides convexus]